MNTTFNSTLFGDSYDEADYSSVVPVTSQPKETGFFDWLKGTAETLIPIATSVLASKQQIEAQKAINDGKKTATPVAGVPTAGTASGGIQLNTQTLLIGGGVLLLGALLLIRSRR